MHFARLQQRAFNRPLLCEANAAALAGAYLAHRAGFNIEAPVKLDRVATESAGSPMLMESGVYVLPVIGGLAHRGDEFDAACGMSSYTHLNNSLMAAMDNKKVKAILLEFDSPGGEAVGCFEFAETLMALRGRGKPIWAIANGMMCSAAYALGCSADRVIAIPSAMVGSIGVVSLHLDVSGAMEKAGVVATYIHAGKHKVDGNPYEKLPPQVRKDMQASIDQFYDRFVASVAAARPNMSDKDVRNTEARVYSAGDAKFLGLVDDVMSFQAALAALENHLSTPAPASTAKAQAEPAHATLESPAMTTEAAPVSAAAPAVNVDAIRAEGYAAGRADAAAILGHAEAKGREKLAARLAANPAMTVDAATEILADSNPAAPAAEGKAPSLRQRLAQEPATTAAAPESDPKAERKAQLKAAGEWAAANS